MSLVLSPLFIGPSNTLNKRGRKPLIEIGIALDELSTIPQESLLVLLARRVGLDEGLPLLGRSMTERQGRNSIQEGGVGHFVSSFPRARRYSATTLASETSV